MASRAQAEAEEQHRARELASAALMENQIGELELEARRRCDAENRRDAESALVARREVQGALHGVLDLLERRVSKVQQIKDDCDRSAREETLAARVQREETLAARVQQGWLRKQGHVRRNWKRRWFVLERGVLRYYVEPLAIHPYGANLRGEINLEDYSVVQSPLSSSEESSMPTRFELFSLSNALSKKKQEQQEGGGRLLSSSRRTLFFGITRSSSARKTASTLVEAEDEAGAAAWVAALQQQQLYFRSADRIQSSSSVYFHLRQHFHRYRKTIHFW